MKKTLVQFINSVSCVVANNRQLFAFLFIGLVFVGLASTCRADTDVDGLVSAATTLWGTVKTLIITIAGFSLLIWVVMKIRSH